VGLEDAITSKRDQFDRLIDDIKGTTARASKEAADSKFELEKDFDARSKEFDRKIRIKETDLERLNTDIGRLESTLADYKQDLESNTKKNTDMENTITETQAIYDELAGKVNKQQSLHEEYKSLIVDQKRLNEEYSDDVRKHKITHDETIAKLNQKMADFKSMLTTEQEALSAQVETQRETLRTVKAEIATAKAEDAERVKNLRTDEDSLSIKIRAFKREQEEFEGERKRLARMSRV
jgi:chromosome segregation ATPase